MSDMQEYVRLPERLEPAPSDGNRGRYVFLFICIAISIVTLFLQSWYGLLIGIIVLGIGALGFKRYQHEPGYLIPKRMIRDLRHKRKDGEFYRDQEDTGKSGGLFAKSAPINIRLTSFPIELSSEKEVWQNDDGEDETDPVDSIAVLHDPSLNRDVTIISYEGRSTRAASGIMRMAADLAFADAIVSPMYVSPNKGTIAHGMRTRPINMGRYSAATMSRLSDQVSDGLARQAAMSDGTFVPANADERLALMEAQKTALIQNNAHDPIKWIAYSIERQKPWLPGDLSNQVDEYDLVRSTLVRLAQAAEESLLDAGVYKPVALDIWGMNRFVKGALSLDTGEWNDVMDQLLEDPNVDPYTDPRCWPWPKQQIITRIDRHGVPYLDIDRTLHRVWFQKARDDRNVYPDTFAPIFESGDIGIASQTGLATVVVGDLFSADRVSKSLDNRILFEKIIGEMGKSENRHISDREARMLSRGIELQRQIDNGGKNGYFNNLYCITSAVEDPRLLEEVDNVVKQHARSVGITLEPIMSPTIALNRFKLATLGVPTAA